MDGTKEGRVDGSKEGELLGMDEGIIDGAVVGELEGNADGTDVEGEELGNAVTSKSRQTSLTNSAETPFWQSKSLLIMCIPFRVEVSTKKHHCPQPACPPTCEFLRVWSFWNDLSQQELLKPNKTQTMQKHQFGSQSPF